MSRREVLKFFDENKAYMDDIVNTGIERNRKGYAKLVLKDKDGNPVKNASVKVNQKTHEFKYGANLFMLDELESDEKNELYKKYFADAFNMATLPFYWDDLEPEKGKQRYEKDSPKIYRRPSPDLCIEFCEKNGIEPREHALAYDHFYPKWLKDASPNEVKAEMERHFREIAERYADKIDTIEVTNEMYWNGRTTAMYDEDDFLEFAYKLARKYFTHNKLAINEWSAVWNGEGRITDQYYAYIKNAMYEGAPIDAIGMQFHMFYKKEDELSSTSKVYNPYQLYKIMNRYAKLNKPIQVTEVTIPAYSNSEEDEKIQAEIIKNLYSIWFSHENVEQIIYWNLVDGYAAFAPQGDMESGENYYYGGLIHFDFTPKPSYYMVKNLFQNVWHTEKEIGTNDEGKAEFKGFYGKYDIEITVDGKTVTKEIDFSKKKSDRFEITL